MSPDDLAALHAACFTVPRPWRADEFETILNLPQTFLLTLDGGFLIGRLAADEAELLTLAVPQHSRRKGIGRGLLQGFLDHTTAKGGRVAFLEVATQNAAALGLYQGQGFQIVATRKNYMRAADGSSKDAHIMRFNLKGCP